ncbi:MULTISPECIES: alpha/beta hydrolase [Maribacter]|uniref:Alpha/beta fold hydrolase n=1 Tax=Maribacter flavus TaxID=1658664 RepID=A0ABU7IE10_9FLAO|nr:MULTISPECIES: alpha/beta fold hydrolase [Maribacter]MDC6404034.1 alpha/beta fold hydrolase [Maribacter sp. PR66]MEE1971175.1 alpha/beta fold hydrolase [Maribacter flavus]
MKKILVILFLSLTSLLSAQEVFQGKVVLDSIYSKNLENDLGENPTRKVSVYLPPNYDGSETRYPVIYFLHGFLNDNSLMDYMKDLLDYAIAAEKIDPFILVIPDQRTTYDGSFYSNTGVFGNWEDFTAYDLVSYMDKNYRTLAKPGSRGITGHSMGGYGALKIAMKHPDIFQTVYALSPGALTIVREYGPNSNTYVEFSKMKTIEDLSKSYFGKVIMAFGRSWSPNPNKPPFYFDLPFEYVNDEIAANPEVLQKWYSEMPVHMIDEYMENLNALRAIKFDWGRNAGERFTIQCKMFSQRLENVGVKHFAEEYIGNHTNNIYTEDGRIPQQMLPFFDYYLDLE